MLFGVLADSYKKTQIFYLFTFKQPRESVIAPIATVRFSPQVFVLSLIFTEHLKSVDTLTIEALHAANVRAAAERLELYHIYFWSYIVLLHFFVTVILGLI